MTRGVARGTAEHSHMHVPPMNVRAQQVLALSQFPTPATQNNLKKEMSQRSKHILYCSAICCQFRTLERMG